MPQSVVDRRSVLALFVAGVTVPILAACSGSSVPTTPDGPARTDDSTVSLSGGGPLVLMIIRHAEKPEGSGPKGITANGDHDSESLTVQGWTRAGALVELFAALTNGRAPIRPGLVLPANVYASNPGHNGSNRPTQTVTPLAAALATPLHSPFEKGQEAKLVESLRDVSGPTLVAWEHENIPAIIESLGDITPQPPSAWPADRYDMVYVFQRASSSSAWTFSQVPQLLLAGDSATPIT